MVRVELRGPGPQLLGVFCTGGVDDRRHGTISLTGGLALTLPFGRRGRLGVCTAGEELLADAGSQSSTRCGTSAL